MGLGMGVSAELCQGGLRVQLYLKTSSSTV